MECIINCAVHWERVRKFYPTGLAGWRRVAAVEDVTLSVPYASVFGLIGPNRAGKTTLLKLLLSLTHPTAGQIYRLGRPVQDIHTLSRVGYMHENHAFPYYLTASEILYLYGGLAGLSGAELRRRVEEELERVGLADRQHEAIRTYSKGMLQRLGLAQALLAEPELLVLDEPTEGLDLAGRQLLRQVVTAMRQQGKTVLIVSHTLAEIEQLCDRVAVLVAGKLAFTGTLAELQANRPEHDTLEKKLMAIYEQRIAI
jgi:ABC-2 type transport system ATP-binding protein